MHKTNKYLKTYFDKCQKSETSDSHIRDDKIMCYKGGTCVPNNPN